MFHPQPPAVVIQHSLDAGVCWESAFVLRAVGIDSEVLPSDRGYSLRVEATDAERARLQLHLYQLENPGAPSPGPKTAGPRSIPEPRVALAAATYALTLVVVDLLVGTGAWSLDWWRAGYADAALIREGQWWRCATALTLHADFAHLAGNTLFGILFGVAASRETGTGRAWLIILLGGMVGNALNALLRDGPHVSVGASTAVFAALGLLAGHAPRGAGPHGIMRRWAPLVAAAVLLSMLGTGGERTDVAAHLLGFLAGLAGGFLSRARPRRSHLERHLPAGCLAVVTLCWAIALWTHG